MKRTLEARLADWTGTVGFVSFLLPFLAVIILTGIGDPRVSWSFCAVLLGLGGLAFWLLHRISKGVGDASAQGWIAAMAYFGVLIFSVSKMFPAWWVLILVGPEVVGLILSVAGLGCHLARNRTEKV